MLHVLALALLLAACGEKAAHNGYSSYLDLLDAERQLFAAELAVADAQRLQLSAVVDLYRALGGGWKPPESN